MARYINKFQTTGDVQTALDRGELSKPYVAYVSGNDSIDFNTKTVNYNNQYLTFNITSGGTINWFGNGKIMYYSKNGGDWTSITSTTDGTAYIDVNTGDSVRFKSDSTNSGSSFQLTTAQFTVEGNIMSMAYGDNFTGKTTALYYMFDSLFAQTNVTSAENLILPATTLADRCYQKMFSGCTSLTTAPELPATTLADRCYQQMFSGCTSLTTAPQLPATTLVNGCYHTMFRQCTSLTTPPALPATTLIESCYESMFRGCTSLTTAPTLSATTLGVKSYYYMFNGCSSLNYIKCLATDISASNCTSNWVNNVSSTGTFVKNKNTSWSSGTSGIPSEWTVQDAE